MHLSPPSRRLTCAAAGLACSMLLSSSTLSAQAETLQIVALGASNTAGLGIAAAAAWPSRLEMLLRARGYAVRVVNAGISGNDTSMMLARMNRAVPDGARLVILDKGKTNDGKRRINPVPMSPQSGTGFTRSGST
jgi:lysophospholipase L1-like esterase